MTKTESARHWLIQTALSYLGTPYIWGGDDPSGFDCSGFVIECLKSVGLISENEDFTAHELRSKFCDLVPHPTGGFGVPHLLGGLQVFDSPAKGNLLFYVDQNSHAYHVAICLDEFFQIGAHGGSRSDMTTRKSWRDNAFVKIRPIGEVSERMIIVDPFRG